MEKMKGAMNDLQKALAGGDDEDDDELGLGDMMMSG